MDITPSLIVLEGPTESSFRSLLDREVSSIAQKTQDGSGFFGLSSLVVCMFVVMSTLIICCFVAFTTWYLAEFVLTPPDVFYDGDGIPGDSRNPDDYADAEPSHDSDRRRVPPIDVLIVTVTRKPLSTPRATSTVTARSPTATPTTESPTSTMTTRSPTSTLTTRGSTSTLTTPSPTSTLATRSPTSTMTTLSSTSTTRKPGPCTTADCHNQSDYLRGQLKFVADPCQDFYEFTCGNYQGPPNGLHDEAQRAFRATSVLALTSAKVPPATSQSAWQKAAGLFQACMAFTNSNARQNDILEPWITSLNFDPTHVPAPGTLDPVETMVRLAVDMGFPVVFDFKLLDTSFIEGKRAMEFSTSTIWEAWRRKRERILNQRNGPRRLMGYFRGWFFIYPGLRNRMNTTALHDYDQNFVMTVTRNVKMTSAFITGAIKDMGSYTAPHITPAQWSDLLSKYTNGTYGADTKIRFQKELLVTLAKLLADPNWGLRGLRAVMTWGLMEYFIPYTSGRQLVFMSNNRPRQDICYEHVSEIMAFAIASHHLISRVNASAVREAADMFSKVRDAFLSTLGSSTWLTDPARSVAVRKVHKMKAHIGSPGQRLNEAFVNQYYAGFEGVNSTARFILEWFKSRRARAHQMWTDQTNPFFSISGTTAFYVYDINVVIVPAGTLQPVFFYADGSAALNYGSLGDALAHRVMNAFDVTGIQYDDSGQINPWLTAETQAHYMNSTDCLRGSHANAGSPNTQGSRLDDQVDSENMGDLVGAATAYNVASAQVAQTLPGLNLTAQQLYFVGRCMTLCKRDSTSRTGRFASPRARCNVPLMNMDAFSAAFGCRLGTRMNPASKCNFWR